MRQSFFLLLTFFVGCTYLTAQEDSLRISFSSLTWEDIRANPQLQINKKVSGASRSLKNIQDLPFSIYVIEGKDIRRNGYITLADALKMLPGIRVSQPGSALEGETFMMRGLLGNAYAKILVNGIPIKPYVVSGMPIGAQLPIQQAERIEVIYGPAAALYGADAGTGVINIVMIDSERPIFTNTSLHVGSESYTSINTLFGGKLGKGSKILKFRLFGTNTRQATRRIFYDDELYNTENYLDQNPARVQALLNNPNYRGTSTEPLLGEVPHLSRSFGVDLSYQNFQLSYKDFFRQDHSAIGLNPAAVSYAIPLNSIGESIQEGHLIYKKDLKFGNTQTTLNFLRYRLENSSSTTYVDPIISNIFTVFALDSIGTSQADSLRMVINDNFFSRIRFANAESFEYSVEQVLNLQLGKTELNSGIRLQRGTGSPFVDFQPQPFEADLDTIQNIIRDPDQDYNELNAFVQLFFTLERWNILLGGAYLYRNATTFSEQVSTINPRLAILFKAKPNLTFRASYSTAFKIPGPFFKDATYTIQQSNFETILTGINPLQSERTISYEMGLRWLPSSKIELDLATYYSRTSDFIIYDILQDFLPDPNISESTLTAGYFNDENTSATLFGVQAMLYLKDLMPSIGLDSRISLGWSKGEESLFQTDGVGLVRGSNKIISLRAYPDLIAQAQLSFNPFSKFTFILDNVFLSGSKTRNLVSLRQAVNDGLDISTLINKGYYTLDIMLNYQLNRNFQISGRFNNILNKEYAGIDANGSPDVLLYNPQSLFAFRIGVNYNLN